MRIRPLTQTKKYAWRDGKLVEVTKGVNPCDQHRLSGLGYIAAEQDACERTARGEKQVQCPNCKRWLWPDEV